MAAKNQPVKPAEIDLEATDVLPIVDFETTVLSTADLSATDTFAVPIIPAGMAELADALREVEYRLERKAMRVEQLQAELAGQHQRVADLEAQLLSATTGAHRTSEHEELRRRSERQHEALQTWQGFRAVTEAMLGECEEKLRSLENQQGKQMAAAIDEKAREGAARYDDQQQQIAQLQEQLQSEQAVALRYSTDLRVAEERIRRLESEAHVSAALMGNLQQHIERLGRDDTGTRPALRFAGGDPAGRALICEETGAEVEYTLGRRTTIGRTTDNDIPIDTTFISRHHAVVLSNADHCIVEDLNSTNGVLVNGRRIVRQMLHDGDTVTVGKTAFRYQQRA
jgi:hypothetical protein